MLVRNYTISTMFVGFSAAGINWIGRDSAACSVCLPMKVTAFKILLFLGCAIG